jgi:hypothetical protein
MPIIAGLAVTRQDLFFWLSIVWLIVLICSFVWVFSRMVA